MVVALVASLAGQVASWRHSSGERRQQLKWLMAGSAAALVGFAIANVPGGAIGSTFYLAGLFVFSLCVGVAVLRYRLFDVDQIISRTLAYAIVTGLLVGVYAGIVLLATEVLNLHGGAVAVAAATLAAAALFNPLRRRVQKIVDRRFNRARYDADRIVAAFAARLQERGRPGTWCGPTWPVRCSGPGEPPTSRSGFRPPDGSDAAAQACEKLVRARSASQAAMSSSSGRPGLTSWAWPTVTSWMPAMAPACHSAILTTSRWSCSLRPRNRQR